MKKILVTHSYFLHFDPKQWKLQQPYPPLGTLYAAAVLREKGYDVRVVDTMFAGSTQVLAEPLRDRPDVVVIYDDGFNYLTKMCLTNMRHAAFEMTRMAKRAGCRVVICSSDSTDHYEQYLDEGADAVLLGEGEETLAELLPALSLPEQRLATVDGIAFREQDSVVKTRRRAVIRNLDELPLPAWDLISLEPYREMWMRSSGYFSLNIGTTRGCPFKCNWCAKPIYGNRYHARSPRHVVNEIRMLQQTAGMDHIWFCDDIFGLKPGWVGEFAELVAQEGLKLRFKIQSRADLLTQENYVQQLALAGCESVWMGAESGSQRILDAMDKGITIQQIEKATTLLKEHGIRPCFFLQFGYTGETMEDIRKTVKMVNRLLPAEIGISVSYPLPGTRFYENVRHQLQEKANWSHSDDLALMFHNTYTPAFYRQLHRYVHSSYRLKMSLRNLRAVVTRPRNSSRGQLRKALSWPYYLPVHLLQWLRLLRLQYIQ